MLFIDFVSIFVDFPIVSEKIINISFKSWNIDIDFSNGIASIFVTLVKNVESRCLLGFKKKFIYYGDVDNSVYFYYANLQTRNVGHTMFFKKKICFSGTMAKMLTILPCHLPINN